MITAHFHGADVANSCYNVLLLMLTCARQSQESKLFNGRVPSLARLIGRVYTAFASVMWQVQVGCTSRSGGKLTQVACIPEDALWCCLLVELSDCIGLLLICVGQALQPHLETAGLFPPVSVPERSADLRALDVGASPLANSAQSFFDTGCAPLCP